MPLTTNQQRDHTSLRPLQTEGRLARQSTKRSSAPARPSMDGPPPADNPYGLFAGLEDADESYTPAVRLLFSLLHEPHGLNVAGDACLFVEAATGGNARLACGSRHTGAAGVWLA